MTEKRWNIYENHIVRNRFECHRMWIRIRMQWQKKEKGKRQIHDNSPGWMWCLRRKSGNHKINHTYIPTNTSIHKTHNCSSKAHTCERRHSKKNGDKFKYSKRSEKKLEKQSKESDLWYLYRMSFRNGETDTKLPKKKSSPSS